MKHCELYCNELDNTYRYMSDSTAKDSDILSPSISKDLQDIKTDMIKQALKNTRPNVKRDLKRNKNHL